MYIPVDGQLIAYYVSVVSERHASEFHCSQLDPPARLDGYLMYIRFAYTVFSCVPGECDSTMGRHPKSSRLMKPLPSSAEASPCVSYSSYLPNEVDECDLNAQMDDETAAKHIIDYFSGWSSVSPLAMSFS